MEQDNYQWWQKRFRKMAEYFTAYRIDHILGFFRIWEIPSHSVHGLLGQFVPALPMSVDEIQSYGLPFQKDFMTKPFINEEMLNKMFGDKAAFVKETFVQHAHDDIYEMRPEYDTQRKVEAYFSDKKDEESIHIREGVYALISNVLFVPDRKHPPCIIQELPFRMISSSGASTGRRKMLSTVCIIIIITNAITSSGIRKR